MNSKYKYLIKNTGILTISNFSSKILVFLIVPLYTYYLSIEEYGNYDLIISTIQLLVPVLSLNIVDGVMRFSMSKDIDRNQVISIGVRYLIVAEFGVAIIIVCNYVTGLWNGLSGFELLTFFYFSFYMLNQFAIQLAKGFEQVNDMAIAGVIGTVSLLAANVIALIFLDSGIRGFFIANIIGQAIPTLFLFYRMRIWRYMHLSIDKNLNREMISYSFPLLFSTIGWWVNSAFDKYVVAIMCGVASNGLISVAYKIPSIINTLQSIFVQAWQISAIKEYETDGSEKFYKEAFVYLNTFICIGASFLLLFNKIISGILFSKEFYKAWELVPFLVLSSVFNSSAGFLGPILSAKKDSISMAKSAVYGALTNIVLNILLVFLMGVKGATIATAMASLVIYYIRRRAIKNIIISSRYKFVMASWMILVIQAIISSFSGFRYIEVLSSVCMVSIVTIFNKEIVSIFKIIKARRI